MVKNHLLCADFVKFGEIMDIEKYILKYKKNTIIYLVCFLLYLLYFFNSTALAFLKYIAIFLLIVSYIVSILTMILVLKQNKKNNLFYLWFACAIVSITLAIYEMLS